MSLSWYEVGGIHRVEVGELQFALLRLAIEFGEHADLDGTGLRENIVGVQQIAGGRR